jgi:ATP-dependent DNA helicase RecQ
MSASSPTYGRQQVYGYLKRYFGFDDFRLGQADVIRSILSGNEAIAVLPTGGGKSLCYQLPAILMPGTSLVISPLIALMRDQVTALRKRGIPAASIDSSQDYAQREAVEQDFVEGRLKLLYVSPERLASQRFLDMLNLVQVPFVAVDEAHCVLRWGHEFREAYLGIRPFLEHLKPAHIGAFTATATPQLRSELAETLGLEDPDVYVRGFFRPNLHLEHEKMGSEDERHKKLLQLVRNRPGNAPALIYAATRQATEDAAAMLCRAGLNASFYHGGCEADYRSQAQDEFIADDLDALVATNAFGMGIDKPDLRLLVHLSLPRSFEDYYQEVGRAGRDGKDSQIVTLWRGADYRTQSFLIDQQPDPGYREAAMRRLNRMYDAMRSTHCVWKRILEYFGDPDVAELDRGCNACASCVSPTRELRSLEGADLASCMAILTCVKQLDGRYGRTRIVKILKGSKAKGVPDWPDSFGALAKVRVAQLESFSQELLDGGYLQVTGSEYPTLGIAPRGLSALEGAEEIALAMPT